MRLQIRIPTDWTAYRLLCTYISSDISVPASIDVMQIKNEEIHIVCTPFSRFQFVRLR